MRITKLKLKKANKMSWYNKRRIEEKYGVSKRGLMTASEIKEEFGIPTEVTTSLFRPIEWHHTNIEGRYGGNPTDFYDSEEIKEALNDPKNEKHEALLKAIAEDKEKRKFKEIDRRTGFFGYSNPDSSNALWFKGTAILVENGYGSRWWILPNGQRKRKIEFITKEEFERKKNKFGYSKEEQKEQNKDHEIEITQIAKLASKEIFEALKDKEKIVTKQEIFEALQKAKERIKPVTNFDGVDETRIIGKTIKYLRELGIEVIRRNRQRS